MDEIGGEKDDYGRRHSQYKTKRISIALTIVSIFVEIIACLIWLAPVSGVFIYPFVSGFAAVLNIISLIISRKNKAIVIINGLISIVLVGLIAYKTAAFIEGGGPYSKAVERKFI